MKDHVHMFNCACSDGNLNYIKENLEKIPLERRDFGFRLAVSNDRIDIVKYLLLPGMLNEKSDNCLTQEQNAFISAFPGKKANSIVRYLIDERKYIPSIDDLCWLQDNDIYFDN